MSVVPVNVLIPSAAEAPVMADFVEHALRVAYVHRAHLTGLPADEWVCPGVYVLLSGDGRGQVYVGKATALRKRLQNHVSRPPLNWTRAVVIRRDTTHGFNSSEIGYLEGRMSAELDAVANLSVVKGKSDADTTLPPHMRLSLDVLLGSMLSALRLAGVDVSKDADELEPGTRAGKQRTQISGTVADLVSAGLVRAGASVYLSQGRRRRRGSVSATGAIMVDGVDYASPSRAAAKSLGLQSSNGWVTWHVGSPDGPTLDHYRQRWLRARSNEES